MKPQKKTENDKELVKQPSPTIEERLEELIEQKKLENEAYRKILKSLNINKNKD